MNALVQRVGTIEALIQRYGSDNSTYTVDIDGDEARYWIDGRAVSRQEFEQRAPRCGPFVVEIGEGR